MIFNYLIFRPAYTESIFGSETSLRQPRYGQEKKGQGKEGLMPEVGVGIKIGRVAVLGDT